MFIFKGFLMFLTKLGIQQITTREEGLILVNIIPAYRIC